MRADASRVLGTTFTGNAARDGRAVQNAGPKRIGDGKEMRDEPGTLMTAPHRRRRDQVSGQ
jgi:hypothetical protein